MVVYRICKKEEIEHIFNDKNFKNVGKSFEINKNTNTHLYTADKKYIHFFKDKDSIFYLDTCADMYICTYCIPDSLLESHYGVGFYLDRTDFRTLEKVSEYAIENEFINFNQLLKIERIKEYIDIEDYIYYDITSKIETIYLSNEIVNKLSSKVDFNKILNLHHILMDSDIAASINSNLNFLIELIPEIKNMIGFEHNHPHHHLDVWNHTLYALSLSETNFDIRLSLLLHDIGKPFSYQEGEVRHFHNHPYVSATMTKTILTRLGFINEYINKICYLIKKHDTPITKKDIENNIDLEYMRYKIQECDALAHHPEKLEKRKKYLESTKKLILKNKL
ncbi:MAG: HD domain-containing protein [Bacilli bacterium]|nr:HD domain-containing protein [Bacilli bacterium]